MLIVLGECRAGEKPSPLTSPFEQQFSVSIPEQSFPETGAGAGVEAGVVVVASGVASNWQRIRIRPNIGFTLPYHFPYSAVPL
jgi:hypothetical protein